MADDSKRINCVKACFEDRLFIDLGREAARQDRKVTELVYLIVRRHMYGNFARFPDDDEGTERDRDAP
jgi:hypothetical protein